MTSEAMPNVLLSSAGRRVALLRLFGEAMEACEYGGDLLVTDLSATAPTYHDVDRAFRSPRCTDDSYIPFMLELCARERVGLLIPLIDTELMVYALHRESFAAQGTEVMVASPEAIALTADKVQTHRWLSEQALPTVRQGSLDEVRRAPEHWPWPLITKPVGGSCSIGVARVESVPELLAAAAGSEPYIVQEIARGNEYTVSVYVDRKGQPRCAVPRLRLEVRAGEVSKGVARRVPAVEDLAMEVARRLPGVWGALNVQIFYDPATDSCAIIEMNLRFGGGFPLAWRSGARYPEWLLRERRGESLEVQPQDWREGVAMLRFDDAVFIDAESLDVTLPDRGVR